MLISIVIPAFMEDRYILKTLDRIASYVKSEFECLVVVDSLQDSTLPFVEQFREKDQRFKIVHNNVRTGPAFAIRTGISHSKGDVVVVFSGDGSDDASQIDLLASLVERGVSVASASRYAKGGQLVGSPLIKGLISRLAGLSLHYLLRFGTRDSTNNFKAYDSSFLHSIKIESEFGFELGLELTVKAWQQNLRIAEISTIWIERTEGVSKFPLLKSLKHYLKWYLKAFQFRTTKKLLISEKLED